MPEYQALLVEHDGGVAILTLNRPAKLNALNRQLSTELHDAMRRMAARDDVGCIVITGAGDRAFSAGGDIHEARELERTETPEEGDAQREVISRTRFEIGTCPKPTIGMINGLAYGGAAALVSSFDMRIGCEHAKFRFLAATYGRVNGTWTLPNQVGWPVAKELLFSGREVLAEEAWRIGLLNHVVPCDELRATTMGLASTIAANDVAAVASLKALMLAQLGTSLEAQWQAEADLAAEATRRRSADDAFASFVERKERTPPG